MCQTFDILYEEKSLPWDVMDLLNINGYDSCNGNPIFFVVLDLEVEKTWEWHGPCPWG